MTMSYFSDPANRSRGMFNELMQALAQSQSASSADEDQRAGEPQAAASGDPLAQALAPFQPALPSDAEQRANAVQIRAILRGMDPGAPDPLRDQWFQGDDP